MTSPTLGSLLLSSTDPERLRDWYAHAFEPVVSQTPGGQYDVLDFGGFYVMIDTRDDIGQVNPEPGRIVLNIDVPDARAVATRLADERWLAELDDRDGSLFGTVIDPDGNYVQFIQLSDEARAAMEAGDGQG